MTLTQFCGIEGFWLGQKTIIKIDVNSKMGFKIVAIYYIEYKYVFVQDAQS